METVQHHDLQNTLTHELGHALGLDHSSIPQATMAASSTQGETSKRALHQDDKEGHSYIYSHPLEGSGPGRQEILPHPPPVDHSMEMTIQTNQAPAGEATV